ncbi:hypothetical protein CV_0058 [Chromobacterium violaceum ATCC 12472]|uniref:Uncharacterized protein n=1 Tax=Chromobacterium violaceum (strain ATCC 12472 / DSM 30191 / JCM 1249 / CCUG 213 / NBRC 12614 / NCIMB 9131 / NCTC 9757 / MK) TaxID=243365 RepID=Q7NPT5_CHRVO|nr:hypothetical protein CV_0058 [Chromobacterium violaceum ATCC 12472]
MHLGLSGRDIPGSARPRGRRADPFPKLSRRPVRQQRAARGGGRRCARSRENGAGGFHRPQSPPPSPTAIRRGATARVEPAAASVPAATSRRCCAGHTPFRPVYIWSP